MDWKVRGTQHGRFGRKSPLIPEPLRFRVGLFQEATGASPSPSGLFAQACFVSILSVDRLVKTPLWPSWRTRRGLLAGAQRASIQRDRNISVFCFSVNKMQEK
jgi:hypothetical protein